ncbi:hypothetical protein [Pedobacter faecalis]|uniref:hypothetical protein n=1 Tax=Pedobacter faecalis TaxID=3041495 RepID=UPI00254C110A|nr:hypothetical protein [Pedobacter sp. ELA7]
MRQRSIIDALYFSLMPMPQEPGTAIKLFEVRQDKVVFARRYADLFKLIYSPGFADGCLLKDFRLAQSGK